MAWIRWRLKNGRFGKKGRGRREKARSPRTTTVKRYYKMRRR